MAALPPDKQQALRRLRNTSQKAKRALNLAADHEKDSARRALAAAQAAENAFRDACSSLNQATCTGRAADCVWYQGFRGGRCLSHPEGRELAARRLGVRGDRQALCYNAGGRLRGHPVTGYTCEASPSDDMQARKLAWETKQGAP